jgi:hypothetical protein
MVNISSETPHKKQINTDMVKAAVAGDWISGRNPYPAYCDDISLALCNRIPLKDLYECYSGYSTPEGNKRCLSKIKLRAVLENEGITVVKSSKHSNQLRVFGVMYEVAYE